MKRKMTILRSCVAMMLALAMLFSVVGCGQSSVAVKDAGQNGGTALQGSEIGSDNTGAADLADKQLPIEQDRESLEQIVDLLGDGISKDALDKMDDKTLGQLAEDLINKLDPDPVLPSDGKEEDEIIRVPVDEDAYNEDGSMNKPFDQVYPDLIENGSVEFDDETLLIKLGSGHSGTVTGGLAAAGVAALDCLFPMSNSAWYEAKLKAGSDAKQVLSAVRALDEVLVAEYNYEVRTADVDISDLGLDNNPEYASQWYMNINGIPESYAELSNPGGSPSVVVAVIDTGVDYDHEDLSQNIWVNTAEVPDNGVDDDENGYIDDYYGYDAVAGHGSADDDNGHGTHVAGIIAAQNNNLGTVGIAYNVKIMPVKAANSSGFLYDSDIMEAVYYACQNGAEVINMSFGGTSCSIGVQEALMEAYSQCVLVASAGNSNMNNEPTETKIAYLPNYPAGLTYVLGVMSVDFYGKESGFSNYDVTPFNGVEYELYAPGEMIMSTLPNDTYGQLSGTSMAAPVVSAMAAILRSEYADRDMYPTKFIYGQLVATSEDTATCYNDKEHGNHNLPPIANLYSALTKLPEPDVGLQDYAIFDTVGLANDDAGKNNGDGVIDGGETIALGITLRNRWGMSEDTIVTLDTIRMGGVSDPYVTILNPSENYGGVGTYSSKDSGKIYTDEIHTAWENPFYIRISEDIPNDYQFTINVTVSAKNALNEEDTKTYVNNGSITLSVRNGMVLPSIIDQDMELTADNLYIIPNGTIIEEGVTVTVGPGTNIQFWTADPEDAYAETYIAYLKVEGTLLVEGTKENPVCIYPSDLMSTYNVEIGGDGSGYISLKYADITNLCKGNDYTGGIIDYAEHCTFRMSNPGKVIYYRALSGNQVVTQSGTSSYNMGTVTLAKDCVFYKLAGKPNSTINCGGKKNRCIFVECAMGVGNAVNCVYLRNMYENATPAYMESPYIVSTMTVSPVSMYELSPENFSVFYNKNNGSTYIKFISADNVSYSNVEAYSKMIAAYIERYLADRYEGAGFAKFETEEELSWAQYNGPKLAYGGVMMGIYYDNTAKDVVWYDGTEVGDFITRDDIEQGDYYTILSKKVSNNTIHNYLYEIPGIILPEEITFPEYVVVLEDNATYQLEAITKPAQVEPEELIYEVVGPDIPVIEVSASGLVTPLDLGHSSVYVYSSDKAVYNYVDFEVIKYVPLEEIVFPEDSIDLILGETAKTNHTLVPEDTSRYQLNFTTSDETVATVDAKGKITAIGVGTATITAERDGITATMEVNCYEETTLFKLSEVVSYGIERVEEGYVSTLVDLPEVITNDNCQPPELVWRSVDESVAVIEDGKLRLLKAGTTTLEVTDTISGLTATGRVIVFDGVVSGVKEMEYFESVGSIFTMDDGSVYYRYFNTSEAPKKIFDANEVTAYYAANRYTSSGTQLQLAVVKDDNTIEIWRLDSENQKGAEAVYTFDDFVGSSAKVIDIATSVAYSGAPAIVVLLDNGCAYGYTDDNDANYNGQLGVGHTGATTGFELVNLENVVELLGGNYYHTGFLTADGCIYAAGSVYDNHNSYSTNYYYAPTLVESNVAQVYEYTSNKYLWLNTEGELCVRDCSRPISYTYQADVTGFDTFNANLDYGQNFPVIGIKDGKPYEFNVYDSEPLLIPVSNNVADAELFDGSYVAYYLATDDGLYLNCYYSRYMEDRQNYLNDIVSFAPMVSEEMTVEETNIVEEVVEGDVLKLTFNKIIGSPTVSLKLYEGDNQVIVKSEIVNLNELHVFRSNGFSEGVTYRLEVSGVTSDGGLVMTPVTYEFTAVDLPDDGEEEPDVDDGAEGGQEPAPDEEEDVEEEPVIHESVYDSTIRVTRTAESFTNELMAYQDLEQYNPNFYGNVILNHISTDTNVTHWLRPTAGSGTGIVTPLGGNYWGTTNETAIGLQIYDGVDQVSLSRLNYKPFLTTAPENTYPFVTSVTILNKEGNAVTKVGNEEITVRVTFNRDMDTTQKLSVRFGSALPYGDYTITGEYVDARTWEGTYRLNTLIENGSQYFSISNGCSATEDLELMPDTARFTFEIDTTAAQALIMQGNATATGIQLSWTQDDFTTLMGYNVYRSTSQNGLYERVNTSVIPADTKAFFDTDVEPGVMYYYNFTVVQTDLSESVPSGKIAIRSLDTMAPNIYHTPVSNAFTGSNLIISATVTDNLNITYAKVFYRTTGTETWKAAVMNRLNDKYSAIIPAADITTDGLEYYIEAFDGVSSAYKGSAETPYLVSVRQAVTANELGDVDGDGRISAKDALIVLKAAYDQYNLTAEQMARADLDGDGKLQTYEALRILKYVNGTEGSLDMRG